MIVSAPHRLRVCLVVTFGLFFSTAWAHAAPPFSEFIDPNPNTGNDFGKTVVPLSNGHVVITAPKDDAGGTDAGAVYLFDGATGVLISTVRGGRANSQIGSAGATALPNGNFLIHSPKWSDGTYTGAVTFVNGVTGMNAVVSMSNSLVGRAGDEVGQVAFLNPVTFLSNGHYVLCHPFWDNAGAVDAGAVTWGSGTSGVSGVISSSNSLVGTTSDDQVGEGLFHSNSTLSPGVVPLSNGNYLVISPYWDNGAAVHAGAVTWGSGTSGVSGIVSSSNSLVGSTTGDRVGNLAAYYDRTGLTILENGDYLVSSPSWDNMGAANAGAVTWGSGTSGVSGVVSSSNSLVGTRSGDRVGLRDHDTSKNGVTVLGNGNYVVASSYWGHETVVAAGAVTWCSGAGGLSGVITSSNSLVGEHEYDRLGSSGAVALTNGNYVVCSPSWNLANIEEVGAATWCNGTTGTYGMVSASNSLIGKERFDRVGEGGATALSNGHYVVISPDWNYSHSGPWGAVTWCDGTTGRSGGITLANSLIGINAGDGGVTALSNGNYVVLTPGWRNGDNVSAGAVTWCNGATGLSGMISSSNSLVGTYISDNVGVDGVKELSNGNYLVISTRWHNAGKAFAGAVTWGSGTSGVKGVVSSSNSLVGVRSLDYVGRGGVHVLDNGNYLVCSPDWDNNLIADAGAVTWGSGVTGVKGVVSSSNSLVGSTANDKVGFISQYSNESSVTLLGNGHYVVRSGQWNHGSMTAAGAVTWGSGLSGVTGAVSSSNSLIGSRAYDHLGYRVLALSNGGYALLSSLESNSFGNPVPCAVGWGRGTGVTSGVVGSHSNSLLGMAGEDDPFLMVDDPVNKTYLGAFPGEGTGRVRVGSQWDGLAASTADISVKQGGPLNDGMGSVPFAPTTVGTQRLLTFTITNAGTLDLDNLALSKDGTHADEFSLGELSGTSIPVGNGSVSFTVTFSPSVIGVRTAVIHVASNVAGSRNPFDITLTGAGVSDDASLTGLTLSSGILEPAFAPDTLEYAASVPNTPATLVVQVVKAEPLAYAQVRANGGSYVSAGSPVPLNVGANTVDVRVTAQDGVTTKIYTLVVTRATAPEIVVHGMSVVIPDGMSYMSGYNDFGFWGTDSMTKTRSFTVTNRGTRALNLTGTPRVQITGAHAADFKVTLMPTTVVEVNAGTTFEVTYDPSAPGVRTAMVSLESDDEDENPFTFVISGQARYGGKAPQTISFTAPAKLPLDGASSFPLSGAASSGLPVEYTIVSGPAAVYGHYLVPNGTGTVKVRASQAGNEEFQAAAPVERVITVSPAATKATIVNLNHTYTGEGCPAVVTGTSEPVVSLIYIGPRGNMFQPPVNVGTYTVRVDFGAGKILTATLNIAKAPLFVIPSDKRRLVGQANPDFDLTYTGFLHGDDAANAITKAPTLMTKATSTSPGGFYPITASGGSSPNYFFVYQNGAMKVETFAASYEALLVDGEARPAARLELTVAATGKTFSAKLATPEETAPVSLSGTLTVPSANETTTGTATVQKGANTYLVTVTLPLTGDFSAEARRNGASLGTTTEGRKLLTLAKGQTLSYVGAHSSLLAPAAAGTGVPAGAGWAVGAIDAKGVLKLAGKLADGTSFTTSLVADVGSNPGYRMFIQPYTPARTGSYLAGAFSLKPHPDLPGRRYVDFSEAVDLTWMKAARQADASYRNGFGPRTARFTLDPWLPPVPAKGSVPAVTLAQRLGLSSPSNPFTVQHSEINSPSFAALPASLALNATTNAVTVVAPANDTKWKVTLTPATGAFAGSFELNDAGKKRTVPFTGILRQPPSTDTSGLIGDGHFLLPSLLKAPDNEILSGEVGFERLAQ